MPLDRAKTSLVKGVLQYVTTLLYLELEAPKQTIFPGFDACIMTLSVCIL